MQTAYKFIVGTPRVLIQRMNRGPIQVARSLAVYMAAAMMAMAAHAAPPPSVANTTHVTASLCLESGKFKRLRSLDNTYFMGEELHLVLKNGHPVRFFRSENANIVTQLDVITGAMTVLKWPSHIEEMTDLNSFSIKEVLSQVDLGGLEGEFEPHKNLTRARALEIIGRSRLLLYAPKTEQFKFIRSAMVVGSKTYRIVDYEITPTKKRNIVLKDAFGNMKRLSLSGDPEESNSNSNLSTEGTTIERSSQTDDEPRVVFDSKKSELSIFPENKPEFRISLLGIKSQLSKLSEKYALDNSGFSVGYNYFLLKLSSKDDGGQLVETALIADLANRTHRIVELPRGFGVPIYSSGISGVRSNSFILRVIQYPNNLGLGVLDPKTGLSTVFSEFKGVDRAFYAADGQLCITRESNGFSGSYSRYRYECLVLPKLGQPAVYSVSTELPVGLAFEQQLSSERMILSKYNPIVGTEEVLPDGGTESNFKALKFYFTTEPVCTADKSQLEEVGNPPDQKSQVTKWLSQFSKPNGFEGKKHLKILVSVLRSGAIKSHPALVKAALLGIILSSDRLYDSLNTQFPELTQISELADLKALSTNEKKIIEHSVENYVNSRVMALGQYPKSTIESLRPLLNVIKELKSAKVKQELADTLADRLVEVAGDSPELSDIFSSKVYKFSYNYLKKYLGLPFDNIVDTTVLRDKDGFHLLQLGIEPFENATISKAGFYITPSVDIQAPTNKTQAAVNKNLTWVYGNQTYKANVTFKHMKAKSDIVPANASPNYDLMTKAGRFHGVVIVGSNYATYTNSLMEHYKYYYQSRGFMFTEPIQIDHIDNYLQDQVSGKEPMHYLIKEAHSDGDEKNLFRFNDQAKLIRGTLNHGSFVETVDLIFPDVNSRSQLLSNAIFGTWIREREKNGGPELIYVNSSCWSHKKAVFEISAAASSRLIEIPTLTVTDAFAVSEKNAMRILIDGIRGQQNYEQIRNSLRENPGYSSRNQNVFIFPDERDFHTHISSLVVEFPSCCAT
jgi:hypothetical protein